MKVGGLGRSLGSWPLARWIADCTSVAAAIDALVEIELEGDVGVALRARAGRSELSPGICVNCFSSGVAIVFAIVSGFAPGYDALTRNDRVIDRGQIIHRQLLVR